MFPAYKKKIGWTGQFLIEPKPKEPTKHQYDYGEKTALTCAFTRNQSGPESIGIGKVSVK